ncbi:solute carrier family 40 member 2-like isoform X2 [Andrographis paniculata]|nr:solute carrier family 40 member 2-like isoform X2 [Andrographis paniculata]
MSANYVAFISLVIVINLTGAVGMLSTLAGTILIEREWVVVISESEEQPPGVLTKMNSIVRRIDLSSKLFAPVVSGFIISFASLTASAITLILWNVLSVCLQYWLFTSVYNGFPRLREISQQRAEGGASASVDLEKQSLFIDSETDHEQRLKNSSKGEREGVDEKLLNNLPYIAAWRLYIKQDVVLPGVALAFLFYNVLSFGSLMTASLEWQGVATYVIGIGRGVSAIMGIAATFVYPVLESRIGTLRTGLWSIWSQWSCLLVCVGSAFVKNEVVAAYMLMGGVASSRLGLWVFDMCVLQQMQDEVAECDRCIVGGVQSSLQSVMDLMTYIMGIIISNPQDFWKLITTSFVVVTVAATVYVVHVYRLRSHLFHWDKLLPPPLCSIYMGMEYKNHNNKPLRGWTNMND